MATIEPATLESGNAIPLLRTLAIHLREIGASHAVMEVTVAELHRNYFGGAHGGLIAALLLIASALGGFLARFLSGEDDFDPDDDPMDVFPWIPTQEV